jgi:hypothetical protein
MKLIIQFLMENSGDLVVSDCKCFELVLDKRQSQTLFFVPCILIQLRNVNHQMHFLNLCFNSFCLLHVSNILCLSSGRLYCTCSLMWYVIHAFKQAVCHVGGCALSFLLLGVCAIIRLEINLYHLRRTTYLGQRHSRNYLGCKCSANIQTYVYAHTLPLHYTTADHINRFLT